MNPSVASFFDRGTCTASHVIYEGRGGMCAIVDSVLNYEAKSGRTSTGSADQIIAFVRENELQVQWLLETHVHADHISAAHYLRRELGGEICIGSGIREVRAAFDRAFQIGPIDDRHDPYFDRLIEDGEQFRIGGLQVQAWHVPGHTPADMAYVVAGLGVFVGDTIFMPDVGTARCDFPGGDARKLYRSIRRLLSLPAETVLYLCHDYPPEGREAGWVCTVMGQRAHNIHVRDGVSEDDFCAMRNARDNTLSLPALILPSIQLNVRAGALPEPQRNGIRYLQIPLDTF